MYILTNQKSIELQTRKGNDIDNSQDPTISKFNQNLFDAIQDKYPDAIQRSEPTGLYNCHGMTFAARRCFVGKTDDVLKILDDDDYEEVDKSNVLPGDIVIYYSDGDVEHSGIVIEKPKSENYYVPKVFSKWASHSEFIHKVNYCPYDTSNIKYYRIIK